ncbi:MAG: ATP-binding cassette domain-containing protein [Neomegalonema sp.]|nr:ATP-binding cassette domain-containing protein [Neomegalonema sp.]
MSAPPLLSLTEIALGWGGKPLFTSVTCAVGRGDRLALVGRNGSGKSTLLKVLAGLVEADSGERFLQPGAKVAYLPQEPDLSGFATLGDYAAADLDEAERYKAEMAMEALEVRASVDPAAASGGEGRRAALARVLAAEPELMLLDEPTNHLDIRAISWLEETLKDTKSGYVLISHDRAFLTALTRATLWIDRGETRRLEQGFAAFEDWRDKVFEEEEVAKQKLDAKIRREEHWVIHGVSGRRKRNVRRMEQFHALKAERRGLTHRQGAAAMALESGQKSGKLVVEAKGISKGFATAQGDRRILLEDFSIKIARGDRVAMVGPNGVGKTTLLKILTGALEPDDGSIRLGSNLEMAVFDQKREALDLDKSLWESLTDDKLLGVKGSNDQVLVRGRPKHVVGYLKEFLFDERQARGPVSALSGGERARLLLAKIMARESNLLVLDEPTNDLDVETLDLLQELLADFDGTTLLVSHDRDFIDRIATTTIAMEGDGKATVYAGGWTDYQTQRQLAEEELSPAKAAKSGGVKGASPPIAGAEAKKPAKLSYNEQRRLSALPKEIARLEAEIAKLEEFLATPNLYEEHPKKFDQAVALHREKQEALETSEMEWLELEERREQIEGG